MSVAEKLIVEPLAISLVRLSLSNFKGVKKFVLDADGRNVMIHGDNATGKTTIADAFLWVLFDKDSSNRKTFNVKTIDDTGESLHGLEHTVELALTVNGQPMKLKKTLTEKWTKKRGEAEKQFTGHETNFWIDDVPAKAGEYSKKVAQLLDEGLFKLLTNPMYFNTQLTWQERRKLLMEVCGDISDAEVIASDDSLATLTDILGGKSIEDYRKIAAEKIKMLNDQIAQIPIRISELNDTLAGEPADYTETERELAERNAEKDAIEKQMVDASVIADTYRARQKEINGLYNALSQKRSELEKAANAEYNTMINEGQQLNRSLSQLQVDINTLENRAKAAEEEHQANDAKMAELRTKWAEVNATTLPEMDPNALACPACGQDLPSDKRQAKIDAARSKFDADKAQQLQQINTQGKALKEKNEGIRSQLVTYEQTLADKKAAAQEVELQFAAVNEKLNQPRETIDVTSHPEYLAIEKQIDALQAESEKPAEDTGNHLLDQKRQVETRINSLNSILNNREVRERTLARIKELGEEQKALAQQIAEFEKAKFLTETFIKQKVALLEESINGRFRAVRFKLFDQQINGGINECCEALVNTNGAWVPYADANSGGKINAGLDILNTLTKHYRVSCPIFVDNRESVTKLFPVEAQTISLVVSAKDKALRIEMEG